MEHSLAIKLSDLSDLGYASIQEITHKMANETLRTGTARWVATPSAYGHITQYEGSSVGVKVEVGFTADEHPQSLSWMAARAYVYALYTGCMDQLRRRAIPDNRRKLLHPGDKEVCAARVGDVRITLVVAVVEVVPKLRAGRTPEREGTT